MREKAFTIKESLALSIVVIIAFVLLALLLVIPDNKPVIYTLTGERTPISEHEPMPEGADPVKWSTSYTYKVVGELGDFNPQKYQRLYPKDIVIAHKEGSFTLYLKGLPDPNFFHDGFIIVKE